MTGPRHSLQVPMRPPELTSIEGVHRKDDTPQSRWLLVAVVLIGLAAVVAGVFATRGAGQVEDQRDAATEQRIDLGRLVVAACARGDVIQNADGQNLCQRAAQVQTEPIPGVQGRPGDPGRDGRGVSDMTVNSAGRLVVTYTDGSTEDVGPVIGAAGADGAPGRGIADVGITTGRLIITFSDGTTQDLGPVVGNDGRDGADGQDGAEGAPGRGIADVDQVEGRLVITYTDGTSQDAGPLPAGPQGDPGPMGECPAGTELEPVVFVGGETGWGCVDQTSDPDPPATDPPTTTSPPETTAGEGG